MVKKVSGWLLIALLILRAEADAQDRLQVPKRFSLTPNAQLSQSSKLAEWRAAAGTFWAETGEPSEKVGSRGKVFLKSLLIPGWGQYSLGAKTSARNFFVAELALWGTVLGFNLYGRWLREDYIDYAVAYAGVNPDGRDSQFWVDIGNFSSIYKYNEEKLRQRYVAALRDPSGPEFWQWDSEAHRQRFEALRIASDRAFERRGFAVFAVVTHHVVSAIHALWVWRQQQAKQALSPPKYRLAWVPDGRQGGVLQLQWQF